MTAASLAAGSQRPMAAGVSPEDSEARDTPQLFGEDVLATFDNCSEGGNALVFECALSTVSGALAV